MINNGSGACGGGEVRRPWEKCGGNHWSSRLLSLMNGTGNGICWDRCAEWWWIHYREMRLNSSRWGMCFLWKYKIWEKKNLSSWRSNHGYLKTNVERVMLVATLIKWWFCSVTSSRLCIAGITMLQQYYTYSIASVYFKPKIARMIE